MIPIAATALQTTARPVEPPALARLLQIGLLAFLTVVDLFATQAVLPVLATRYGVAPSAMGAAVNASTIGMAIASLAVARFGHGIDRRRGASLALVLLALPTALLAVAPDLGVFAALRLLQGLCMATAFSLTLAALAETSAPQATASAFAAYITGNVASNLFGRLMSASLADLIGVGTSFHVFAALNLAGAALAWAALGASGARERPLPRAVGTSLRSQLADPRLRASLMIGFCILFAFIATFTYVNFVLVRPPFSLGMMSIGLVYLVFLPSILTTPLAASLATRIGARKAILLGLAIALAGLPLLLAASLAPVLAGLALVGIGTFLAQASTTAFVGRTGRSDPSSASGLYLAAYFMGGIAGSIVLGQVFDRWGWSPTVLGLAAALGVAAIHARRLRHDDEAAR